MKAVWGIDIRLAGARPKRKAIPRARYRAGSFSVGRTTAHLLVSLVPEEVRDTLLGLAGDRQFRDIGAVIQLALGRVFLRVGAPRAR